jgi:flagellin
MDVLNLGDNTAPLMWQTEQELATATTRLSSGLRINTAADDPSGLAISENLLSLANGFGRGAQNVDDAVNALTVADGALQNVTDILQRIRTLTVEANSDITSTTDRQDIQAEINQAMDEINSIAQNTTFNGRKLLDGSAANPVPAQPVGTVTQVTSPTNPSTGASSDQVANAQQGPQPGPGPLVTNVTVGTAGPAGYAQPPGAMLTVQVMGVDQATGGIIVRTTYYSSDPTFGPAVVQDDEYAPNSGASVQMFTDGTGAFPVSYQIANLTAQDVGASASFIIDSPQPAQTNGSALQVQYGASEGATTTVGINSVSTQALGIAGITVTPPQVTTYFIPFSPAVQENSSQISATYAEYKVDAAIQQVTTQRAALGAQMVSLQDGASNDLVAQNSLTAAESTIRDVDVASEVTQFTKLQITSQFQIQVLRQSDQMATMFYQLLTSNL